MTAILNTVLRDSHDFLSFLSFLSSPQASQIDQCFVNVIESRCALTVRWFPLVCAAGGILTKALVAFIAVRQHPHFRTRVFNLLGDMITLGSRHPQFLESLAKGRKPIFDGPCDEQRIRWIRSFGVLDWVAMLYFWSSSLGLMIFGLVKWFYITGGLSFSERFRQYGLGTISPLTIFNPDQSSNKDPGTFPLQISVANSPQLLLSAGYLLWNNQISRIWMEREWRRYYCRQHRPQVSYSSSERGTRPTRWLQLPSWLTAVLMTISTLFIGFCPKQCLWLRNLEMTSPPRATFTIQTIRLSR